MNNYILAVNIIIVIIIVVFLLAILVRAITFHPKKLQAETVWAGGEAPILKPGQIIKILSYNIQFMAGKNYVFFYDVPGEGGPDSRPRPQDISKTFDEVARVIKAENPDIILLQEVNDGAKSTDYEDQLARLLKLLPKEYICHTSAFYWKAKFVPHRHINGPVGMKLSIISKYKIEKSVRHQLPLIPQNILVRQFYLKRAVLETHLPVEGAKGLVVLNTHLDAFAQGTNTMQKQVARVDQILARLNQNGNPWLIGGDFNLLPPGKQFQNLDDNFKIYYQPKTEMLTLFNKYRAIPSLEDANGPQTSKWFTFLPNYPNVKMPIKTIDYLFYADNLKLKQKYVRQHDTLKISDHLPIIGKFMLPGSYQGK